MMRKLGEAMRKKFEEKAAELENEISNSRMAFLKKK